MVKLNFTLPGAADMIRSGRKVTTIRRISAKKEEQLRRIRRIQLYEGSWRTKDQVLIAEAELVCVYLLEVPLGMFIDTISPHLLRSEGFETKEDMRSFFVGQYGPDVLEDCTFSLVGFQLVPEESKECAPMTPIYDESGFITLYLARNDETIPAAGGEEE